VSSGKPRCRRDQVWSPAGDVASPSLGHRHRAEDRLAAVGRQQWGITGRCLCEEPIAQHIGCLIRALRYWRDVRWLLDISGSRANLVALDAPLRKLEPGREAWLPVVCRGRAADLLKGGRVDPTQPGPAIKAIDQELDILRGAIIEKTRALDEIARDLAYTESQKLVPEFSEAMRGALAAMEALARAFGAAAGLADQLRRAGYRPSAVLLPDLALIAARALGDPESQISEAYEFRRDLEELGVVCCLICSRNSISARAVLSSRPSSRPSWRGCRRCARLPRRPKRRPKRRNTGSTPSSSDSIRQPWPGRGITDLVRAA